MAPKLYIFWISPPVRAVLMTAKAIGLELELKELKLEEGEHLKPEYLKLNPQHTVPTLVDDDGFVLWESHAIMAYLVSKYAKNDSLYPKDLKKRAVVDQRLHFESGVSFARGRKIIRPMILGGKKTIEEEEKASLDEVYGFLEAFLKDNQWIAGNDITIADYSLIAGLSQVGLVYKPDPTKFPKVATWLKNAESLPVYDLNLKGLEKLTNLFKSLNVELAS